MDFMRAMVLKRMVHAVHVGGHENDSTGMFAALAVQDHFPRNSVCIRMRPNTCASCTRTQIVRQAIFGALRKGPTFHGFAKLKGDKKSEMKLSNGWSQSYREIKLPLSAGKWVVAKLQGDKSAPQSSMELYDPWISGPLRIPCQRLISETVGV